MNSFFQKTNQKGFTLVEMMVAVAIFTLIIVSGMTGLLSIQNAYNNTRAQRAVLDSLSFVLDSMSRDIRTGFDYQCNGSGDCYTLAGGSSLAFIDQNGCEIGYALDAGTIVRSVTCGGSNQTQNMTNIQSVEVTNLKFHVYGTSTSANDTEQPFVVMVVGAQTEEGGDIIDINLQTTVSQRLIDIPSGL